MISFLKLILIGIGRYQLSAILPITDIGRLVRWYRPIVVFALYRLHVSDDVTEIKFVYASTYVICRNMRVAFISGKSGCIL